MGIDGSLNVSALARLQDGLCGMPVPDYGDLPDAAKELIYLMVSTAQNRTDRVRVEILKTLTQLDGDT